MMRYTPPTTELQSFDCPHCHAKAHQTWHESYIKEIQNPPDPLTKKKLEDIIQENSEGFNQIPGPIHIQIERTINGLPTLIEIHERLDGAKVENVFTSKCFSCDEITIWLHKKIIWPHTSDAEQANTDMPSDVKVDFEEARSIVNQSPRAAAAILRLCIEKLCKDVPGKTLDNKIGNLVKSGLSEDVQKALDAVRVIGNESIHAGEINLNDDSDTAHTLFKIVNIIVSRLISEKKQIESIFEKLPIAKKDGIKARDKTATREESPLP